MEITGAHPSWQDRTIQLLGEEKHARLVKSNVLVVGMGGVGSMAAEMICRSGVGKMTLIDGDMIQPTNLNRQIPALHSTLGRGKAAVMGDRLMDINPGLRLTVLNEFITDERIPGILEESFDYVVDAIDTLTPKIYLIYHSLKKGLKLTSSMGSGGRLDPSQVKVADFGDTYNCRLAYILRKKLRKMLNSAFLQDPCNFEWVFTVVIKCFIDSPNPNCYEKADYYSGGILFYCSICRCTIIQIRNQGRGRVFLAENR
jgi:tRNA A37 threonylcarbamoyladenosine dehydratase